MEHTDAVIKAGQIEDIDLTGASRSVWSLPMDGDDPHKHTAFPIWILADGTIYIPLQTKHDVEAFKRTSIGRKVLGN